jgi:DNA end-binding protein Ku
VLRDAITSTGKIALSRIVIARREHPIALMPMGKGLVIHTLHEERDLNDYGAIFDQLPSTKPDPDMIQLATQLIDRQTGKYDPADIEDRYESRLRAVIDAKLKGEGIEAEAIEEPDRSNVVDLMAALRKSLGQTEEKTETPKKAAAKATSALKAKGVKPAPKTPSAPTKLAATTRKRA